MIMHAPQSGVVVHICLPQQVQIIGKFDVCADSVHQADFPLPYSLFYIIHTTPDLYCQLQEAWISVQMMLPTEQCHTPEQASIGSVQIESEKLSDIMAVEQFTGQFEEKLVAEYSIALCRVECQLAQQSSLIPCYFKVLWNLTQARHPFLQKLIDMCKVLN